MFLVMALWQYAVRMSPDIGRGFHPTFLDGGWDMYGF